MWAKKYDRCVECGTTDRKHEGHGLCYNCYHRHDMQDRATNNEGPAREGGVYFVYALLDPGDGKPRYVGVTQCPDDRYERHCRFHGHKGNGRLRRWLETLEARGAKPQMRLLERVKIDRAVEDFVHHHRELWWIRYMRERGLPLTNIIPK